MADERKAEIPAIWDAFLDLGFRRFVYSSLAGAVSGVFIFRLNRKIEDFAPVLQNHPYLKRRGILLRDLWSRTQFRLRNCSRSRRAVAPLQVDVVKDDVSARNCVTASKLHGLLAS
ncbi:hypothetical protein SASPL_134555 [Salvia splendens]|uniref:Uncharacterized protein n=1 Tax=Salvia splendens TaxID=180675 RepID=A0A8X8X753_SALSN|nr:hypothetical protein SASPL_134555 [Salvia splendens]